MGNHSMVDFFEDVSGIKGCGRVGKKLAWVCANPRESV